jgi:hypothetical protein
MICNFNSTSFGENHKAEINYRRMTACEGKSGTKREQSNAPCFWNLRLQ